MVSGRRYCQNYLIKRQNRRVSNWVDAKFQCERKGMSLVKIDNMEEDAFLRRFLEGENRELFWITMIKLLIDSYFLCIFIGYLTLSICIIVVH